MKSYYYPDRTEVKEGDICFYSEYDENDAEPTHYADSIKEIINIDGELYAQTRIFNRFEEEYELYNGNDAVPIKYGTKMYDKNADTLDDFKKIGEVGKDDHMLTVEYVNENFPLTD